MRQLKETAVRCQNFELASELRALETTLFPETQAQKDAKALVKDLDLVFRMVDLKIDAKTIWVIQETLKAYSEKKGLFAIDDASKIIFTGADLFDI